MTAHPSPRPKKPLAAPKARRQARKRSAPDAPRLNLKMTAKQRKEAIALLESWMNVSEEEAQEQRETFEALVKGLNESRKGYRLHFPGEPGA